MKVVSEAIGVLSKLREETLKDKPDLVKIDYGLEIVINYLITFNGVEDSELLNLFN